MREPKSRLGAFLRLGVLLLIAVGLFALWRWTPLGEWLDPEKLIAWGKEWKAHPVAPFLTIAGFGFGCVLMLPVTPMILAISAVYEMPWNALLALGGCVAGSIPTFWFGRFLGQDALEFLAKGPRMRRLNKLLGRHGILACAVIRVIPVAPFTVVNMLVGATEIKFRDYLIGTTIGMAPVVIGIALIGNRLAAAIQNPTIGSVAILVGVAVVVVVAVTLLRRAVQARLDRPTGSTSAPD